MFQVSIVIFREFLEIAILLSLFSAASRGIKDFKIYLTAGILIGCFGASLIAFFADQISNSLEGSGDEIFDASIILLTVAMLCSTLIWMKSYSTKLKTKINSLSGDIDTSLISKVLFVSLISTTIFREGSEIVLILRSMSTLNQNEASVYMNGLAVGATLGILCGLGLYQGMFRFATKYIFAISSFFMTFIAAGLSAEAAKILSSVGVINIYQNRLWDTSWIISDESISGRFLKIVIGYSARPIGIEVIFYTSTIMIIIILGKIFAGKKA